MSRILLAADVPDWAWWHMCTGILKWSPDDVEVTVVDQQGYATLCRADADIFDAVLQCSWMESTNPRKVSIGRKNHTLFASEGAMYPYPPEKATIPAKIATPIRNDREAERRVDPFDRVLCVNKTLHYVAQSMVGDRARLVLPGVCHETFLPFRKPVSPDGLVIGWCGQSKGLTKGYNEVVVPLMRLLPAGVRWVFNMRDASSPLSQSEMADWYRSIDILLTTSCSEGFQMPPLEAMACGKPVIATLAGGVDEIVNDETGWLLPSWDTEAAGRAAATSIANLIDSLTESDVVEKGRSAFDFVMEKFTWQTRVQNWLEAML